MNLKEAIEQIEDLIKAFGEELADEEYLDALSEMSGRSTDAYNARNEELAERDESEP